MAPHLSGKLSRVPVDYMLFRNVELLPFHAEFLALVWKRFVSSRIATAARRSMPVRWRFDCFQSFRYYLASSNPEYSACNWQAMLSKVKSLASSILRPVNVSTR